MICEKCGKYIYFFKKYEEFILDKYLLIYTNNSNYYENNQCLRLNPKLYVTFEKLIRHIMENNDYDIFRGLKNRIIDDFSIICENCNYINNVNFTLDIPNEFYFYIDSYIEFIIDNTVIKYTGMPLSEFSININVYNYEVLYDNLPKAYNKDKKLLKKLFQVKDIIPVSFEGGGDGPIIIEWMLEQFKIEVFGIILNAIIIGGSIKLIDKYIKPIVIKRKIKKKIKSGQKYWSDVSFEDLKNYITIPKDFNGSKEELIENILNIKYEEYKNIMIEKLR